jgi:hypothetical protein
VSPEPYVRGQALVLAVFLGAAATLGAPVLGLIAAATGAVAARALYAKYRNDVRTASLPVPHHRERLDLIVAGDARASLATGVALNLLALLFAGDAVHIPNGPSHAIGVMAIVVMVVYISSLFDWYITLPRISGLLGARPCRRGEEPPTFPRTWRETTRWWYIHRIVAAVVLRFGLVYAIALAASEWIGLGIEARLFASALLVVLSAYVQAIPRAVREAGHPRLIVGRTVERRDVRKKDPLRIRIGRRTILKIPHWKYEPVGPSRRVYIYDVAVEGVQYVEAARRERPQPNPPEYERDPVRIPLNEVDKSRPASEDFHGCANGRCSGISWYCIDNPRCFETK